MSETIALDLDGYTDLPPGRIANVVTYLEMKARPAPSTEAETASSRTVRHVKKPELAAYRKLYARIGTDWLWFSRAVMTDDALAAVLARPTTEIHFLEQDGEPVGLAELHRGEGGPADVEIAMFGVVPEATGTGAARQLMLAALAAAWGGGTERVWLHTCSFDHPAALRFYRRSGFTPFKFAIEVSTDPRLDGHLPRTAGPHVALIDPASTD
ncbi:N-acetyltransferase [Kaistia sp. 32K]|uniref:GNAT family N-acetyltransferase n=1 Tax=Kaistia sp. 32K TaxID=2795690 RepID=UPI001915FD6D|nr:GNAT family N-acetyltransferase [Kaistia sp. 32K]BCP54898.1 N-acetyltransferase [Kaistia sp. 32K]